MLFQSGIIYAIIIAAIGEENGIRTLKMVYVMDSIGLLIALKKD
jgi:hypothetical protein